MLGRELQIAAQQQRGRGAAQQRLARKNQTALRVGQQHVVGLIGHVAEKIAFDDGCSALQLLCLELLIAVEHGIELLLEAAPFSVGMYHHMIFCDFSLTLEAEDLSVCVILFK